MKNKKLLFVLVPLVIIVWGLIIMKVINGVENSEAYLPDEVLVSEEPLDELKVDTFSLLLNYKDPFSVSNRRSVVRQRSGNKKLVKPQNLSSTKLKVETWPSVKYSGIIQNKKSKNKVGLLNIDNTDHLVKEKEKVNGLTVIKITRDSIVLKQESSIKAFYL